MLMLIVVVTVMKYLTYITIDSNGLILVSLATTKIATTLGVRRA